MKLNKNSKKNSNKNDLNMNLNKNKIIMLSFLQALLFVLSIFILLIFVLSINIIDVNAHGIEKSLLEKSTDKYEVEFSYSPDFPVVGRETHFDIEVKDKGGVHLKNLDVELELHKGELTIDLEAEEKEQHYDIGYIFKEKGNYLIHIEIEGIEIEIGELFVDDFGLSGFIRSSVILIFILTLIILAYRDCRKIGAG